MLMSTIKNMITNTPDFPEPGIQFKDITPILANEQAFDEVCHDIYSHVPQFDCVAGIESRGFPIAGALAQKYHTGCVLIRKPGKLPPPVFSESYKKEYGVDTLEIKKAPRPGIKLFIVDDLCGLGGTMEAAVKLARQAGYDVVGTACMIELTDLDGRRRVQDLGVPFFSVFDFNI